MDSEFNDLFDASGRLILPDPTQTEAQYRPSRDAYEVNLPSWVGTDWGSVFRYMGYTVEKDVLSLKSRRESLIHIYEAKFVSESLYCDDDYFRELGEPCSFERLQFIREWLDAKIELDLPRLRVAQTKWQEDKSWFENYIPWPITD